MSAPPTAAIDELRQIRVWRRFHVVITALFGLPMFAVLTVMCGYFYVRGVDIEMRALQSRLIGMSTALAGTLDPALVKGDPTEERALPIRALFDRLAADEPDVNSIYIMRRTPDPTQVQFVVDWTREDDDHAASGELYAVEQAPLLASAFDAAQVEEEIYADAWGETLSGYAPIRSNGTAVAVVGVDLLGSRVHDVKREVLLTTLGVYGLATLVLFVLAQIVAWSIRAPLARIISTTQAITQGQLDARAGLDRLDEFGILGRHFDGMAAGLKEREFIRDTFGRYMSERLAKRLLGDPTATQLGGEEIEVTILLSDVRSYSTISERLSPTQVVAMLNQYMGAMGAVVDEHGGIVIEFLGDGILAVFGAPEHDPQHAEHAARCALAMQKKLAELNQHWETSGLADLWKQAGVDKLRARVGVHTGTVVAGNMGGYRRMKYAVIGESVTIASRVEALNNKTDSDILLTAATRAQLPPDLQSVTIPKGQHTLKDVPAPVEVFALAAAVSA